MIWIQTWLTTFGPILAGLLIGVAAKYGLVLVEGRAITVRGLVGDLLLLGLLGLIAIAIADWLDLTGNLRVLVGALAAVSSDRLARLARDQFMAKVRIGLAAAGAAFVAALAPRARPAAPDLPPQEPEL